MPTYDIPFRGSVPPQFPDLCVGCEREHPQHVAHISCTGARSTFGWAVDATLLAASHVVQGTNVTVKMDVPCCAQCAPALQRHHFWKKVLLYVSGFGGALALLGVVVFGSSHGWSSGLTVTLGLIALLAVVAAPVVWEMRYPPAFTLTPRDGDVVFEFRSEKCAGIFQALNLNRTSTPKTGSETIPRPASSVG